MVMEMYIYLSITLWAVVVTTHGLTLAYSVVPVIKQEVVEVKYLPKTVNVNSFTQEWTIDEQAMMHRFMPGEIEMLQKRSKREAFIRLWESVPEDMYEFYSIETYHRYGPEKVYGIKIKVLPPTKGYDFNGEYYTKSNV